VNGRPNTRITRRAFLARSAAAAAVAAIGPRALRAADADAPSRRVWAFADSHVGLVHDGKDGADWLALALADLKRNVKPCDYALGLGDLTHNAGAEAELRGYLKVRDAAGLPAWYELAGNHDFGAIPAGRWAELIKRPRNYAVVDGNAVWLLISARQGKSEGRVSRAVGNWLLAQAQAHRDRNVIVCSHQAVYKTVAGSGGEETYLMHRGFVQRIIDRARIDLWLCGHIHGGRRNRRYIVRRGRTTFINVASVNHAYGTGAAHGCVLEMAGGAKTLLARCRHHDRARYLPDQQATVPMPHSWKFDGKPTVVPAKVR